MAKKILFQKDKYRRNRGGHSRWLQLFCEKCGQDLFVYQKDGPGILKRLYLDRISGLGTKNKTLSCKKCQATLGVEYIYEKEKRPAYRLFVGAVGKKIIKATKLPLSK